MDDRRARLSELSLAFVLGALAGAGVALLVAPASGKETRDKIKQYGEKAYQAGRKSIESGKEKVNQAVAAAKGRFHAEPEA